MCMRERVVCKVQACRVGSSTELDRLDARRQDFGGIRKQIQATKYFTYTVSTTPSHKMSKRPADESEDSPGALKSGGRPVQQNGVEDLEFEDEFEDEFESDEEILEAGVDGRPDAEREAEERDGL